MCVRFSVLFMVCSDRLVYYPACLPPICLALFPIGLYFVDEKGPLDDKNTELQWQ